VFRFSLDRREVSAASVFALPFALALVVMSRLAPPTPAQWAAADPILKLLPKPWVLWLVPALGVVVTLVWLRSVPRDRAVLVRAARQAVLGALVAICAAVVLRLIVGPVPPAFVPPEESGRPGFLLGISAGYVEEVLFRLALLPAIYFGMPRAQAASGVVLTAVGFALLHWTAAEPAAAAHFMTRLLFPGALMSLAALTVGPTFVVTAHATAHILIPVLFP
jgi:hypothetical protein